MTNNDSVVYSKGRRKAAVTRTCPLCKRVFHMSQVSLAEVASHISRCCDANFPAKKPVTKESKKRQILPPDDAKEIGKRKNSLEFLIEGDVRGTLEEITLCYLSSF